jgi:hypothetical protein
MPLAELIAPVADRFVADHDSTCRHHLLDIAKAHTKAEIVPDAFGDHLAREPVTTVRIVRHSIQHCNRQQRPNVTMPPPYPRPEAGKEPDRSI